MKKSHKTGLSSEAEALFDRVASEWGIADAAGTAILRTACEALDRLREAQALLRRDGAIITDRFKQVRLHPATVLEREARSGMLNALKALDLNLADAGLDDAP